MFVVDVVLKVLEIKEEDVTAGVIEYDTGDVVYTVKYHALLFRPFKNEVLDAVITEVTIFGIACCVGPLRIFVSRHNMPSDISGGFDGEKEYYISDDKTIFMKKGCGVRLKIVNTNCDTNFDDNNITTIG